jgi:hypothetical protein
MYVDRAVKIDLVNNNLKATALDSLDIYLENADINCLANVSLRHTVHRFMECSTQGSIEGWAPEDKMHMRLETPQNADDYNRFVDLSVDPGGDLYFAIWNSWALRGAHMHEQFLIDDSFVRSDPSNRLGQVGIKTVRIHDLHELAARLT